MSRKLYRKKVAGASLAIAMMFPLVLGLGACDATEGAQGENDPTTNSGAVATGDPVVTESEDDSSVTEEEAALVEYASPLVATYDEEDLDDSWDPSEATLITLSGGSAVVQGEGASVEGDRITVSQAGIYVVTGALTDGQIFVNSDDGGVVKLVLNGVDLSCSTSAPIYIANVGKAVITLAEGSANRVTDGESYVLEDVDSDEPNGAVFSKADLTINGTGSLTVIGNYNHGIVGKDDLKIVSGDLAVTAVNDGIKGRDCIAVKDGVITVEAGGDGLQSNNDQDTGKGFVCISGGVLDIVAGTDGIQAETTLVVSGGDIALVTGGGSKNSSSNSDGDWGNWGRPRGDWGLSDTSDATTDSATDGSLTTAKGLKAGGAVFVDGGMITVDSSDDCIHSNNTIEIDGGTITLTSGDDGVHADAVLNVNGGDLTITKSYEGMESAVIAINGGTLHIVAGDDGINVAGGVDASSVSGRPGQGSFAPNANNRLDINGGHIVIDAGGDGIDCNGSMFMAGGSALINGPTESMNGPIDYLGEFAVSGGFLVAVGSSGMAQAPSDSSTQHAFMVNFDTVQSAGTLVRVEAEDGSAVVTFEPAKQYQSLLVSSPDLKEGATYTVYLGGECSGAVADGLYTGGVYTSGSKYTTVTMTTMVVTSGAAGGMPGGGRGKGTMPGGGASGSRGTVPDGTLPDGTPPDGTL